jgi:hypothetical protein
MSAADHYAQAEAFLAQQREDGFPDLVLAAVAHSLLALAGFVVQFSVAGAVHLSDEARDAQRVVEE